MRRVILTLIFYFLIIPAALSCEVAIIIEDFNVKSTQSDQMILDALKRHKFYTKMFVACKFLDRSILRGRLRTLACQFDDEKGFDLFQWN